MPTDGANVAHCQRQVWDFEDQSGGGIKPMVEPSAITSMGITTRQVHEGRYSLGMSVVAMGRG